MHSQIRLGRIFGIEIGLHYSWFIIAFLIVVSLGAQFRAAHPAWGGQLSVALALLTGLLFFLSLLLHELAHSLFAQRHGLPVREITLFALGGVSQIEKNPASAKTEFWMAFVGPLTSAVIGLLCEVLRSLAGSPARPPYVMLAWLGYINLALAVFNLVPGYPLDGGRILRAAIWWKTGDVERSTRLAARIGQIVGGIFIAFGILQFFGGAGFGGLWMAFIGWFLLQAAGESYLQSGLSRALNRVAVGDLMSRECPGVDGHLNVEHFVDDLLLRTGGRCFMVTESGKLEGMVTPREIKTVERRKWPFTTLLEIMRPIGQIKTVAPETPLRDALEIMGREDLNQVPVMSNGHVAGVLSRAQVLNYLQTREELGR